MAQIERGDRVKVKNGDSVVLTVLSVFGEKAACSNMGTPGKEYLISDLELVSKGGPIRPLRPSFG